MTSFTVSEENVEANVYKQTGTKNTPVYLVKVSFTDIGVYINGIRIQDSPKFPGQGPWVQMPGFNLGGRFYKNIECSKDSPLLEIVTRKAWEAVGVWCQENDKNWLNDIPIVKDVPQKNSYSNSTAFNKGLLDSMNDLFPNEAGQ